MIIRPLTEAEAKHIRELLRSASARREHNQFVIEGEHLLEVAIQERADIAYCAFTEDARQSAIFRKAEAAAIPIRTIPTKLARRLSDTESPQGIFAVTDIRPSSDVEGDVLLALDAVQDPGNVGTLLRTAAWFGIRTVLLGEGCADAYNPKVVRATQGAIFTLNIRERVNLVSELPILAKSGLTSIATVLDASAHELNTVHPKSGFVVVLGNEAHGISSDVRRVCDHSVFIPRLGHGESLNVAASGAIVLYHFTRPQ